MCQIFGCLSNQMPWFESMQSCCFLFLLVFCCFAFLIIIIIIIFCLFGAWCALNFSPPQREKAKPAKREKRKKKVGTESNYSCCYFIIINSFLLLPLLFQNNIFFLFLFVPSLRLHTNATSYLIISFMEIIFYAD